MMSFYITSQWWGCLSKRGRFKARLLNFNKGYKLYSGSPVLTRINNEDGSLDIFIRGDDPNEE